MILIHLQINNLNLQKDSLTIISKNQQLRRRQQIVSLSCLTVMSYTENCFFDTTLHPSSNYLMSPWPRTDFMSSNIHQLILRHKKLSSPEENDENQRSHLNWILKLHFPTLFHTRLVNSTVFQSLVVTRFFFLMLVSNASTNASLK